MVVQKPWPVMLGFKLDVTWYVPWSAISNLNYDLVNGTHAKEEVVTLSSSVCI